MEIAPLAQLQQTQKLLEYVNRLLPEIMKEVCMYSQYLSVDSGGQVCCLLLFWGKISNIVLLKTTQRPIK